MVEGWRESINKKKEEIKKNPLYCLERVLLKIGQSNPANPELVEWAIAFAEYFEEHPEEWEGIKSSSSPKVRSIKEKIENFLELFGKVK